MENIDIESSNLTNEDKITKELKQIRKLLSALIGTSDLPAKEKFSKEAVSKASKEFKKLQIARNEWVDNYDISSIIKHSNHKSGKILIEQFQFKNYFKRGNITFFKKKDLIDLDKELKKRKINLEKYDELLRDKQKFEKYVESILVGKGSKKRRRFKIPEGLEDIFSKPYSPPLEGLVRDEIESLMEEYEKFDLSEYVDLFERKTYALFKYNYSFDRYIKPELKKFCKGWSLKFNYANTALKRIIELKNEVAPKPNQS